MKRYRIGKNQKREIILTGGGHYRIELVGQGAEAHIVGAFFLTGKRHLELSIEVTHTAAHTQANTNLRAVVDGQARADIRGIIKVKKNAQHTDSFLSEKVLLVSDQARAEAVPNLEIEAHEVHCSHAATVGRIDPEELFYLESRGVTGTAAKDMIIQGFLAPARGTHV